MLAPDHQGPSNLELSSCLWDSNDDAMHFFKDEIVKLKEPGASSTGGQQKVSFFVSMQRLLLIENVQSYLTTFLVSALNAPLSCRPCPGPTCCHLPKIRLKSLHPPQGCVEHKVRHSSIALSSLGAVFLS